MRKGFLVPIVLEQEQHKNRGAMTKIFLFVVVWLGLIYVQYNVAICTYVFAAAARLFVPVIYVPACVSPPPPRSDAGGAEQSKCCRLSDACSVFTLANTRVVCIYSGRLASCFLRCTYTFAFFRDVYRSVASSTPERCG